MKQLYSYYCSIIISTSSSYIQNTVLCSYIATIAENKERNKGIHIHVL
jgi:hypothetical protein